MKRLLLVLMCLSVCFSNVLVAQTYEDGIASYNEANIAKMAGGAKKDEQKALKRAYQIFKALATEKKPKALIMYYLLALKLGETFPHQNLLNGYVQSEHPDYRTIEGLEILSADKTQVRDKIKDLAVQNREKAGELIEDAKNFADQGDYGSALDKVSEAKKLWRQDGTSALESKYTRLKKEKDTKQLISRVKELTRQDLFQAAVKTIDGAKKLLDQSQVASLKGEVKGSWYRKVLNEARIEYKNKNYSEAIDKCDEAYRILASDEALKLKRKAEKRIKSGVTRRFAFFADFGMLGAFRMEPMNYSWNGNSTSIVDLRDHGTLTGDLDVEDEESAKLGYSFSGGFIVMLSPSFGISASISSLFKQKFNIESDYSFSWEWLDGRKNTDNRYFTDSGSISVTPISLNLLATLKKTGSSVITLYGGPTLFLANVDLSTRIGYGVVGLKSDGYYYVEWFPFEYRIKTSESTFGGNIGIDYEFGGKTRAYIGVQYFFAAAKEYQWELDVKRYDGEFGYFYVSDPSQFPSMPSYKSKINFSSFKINVGIKFFF